MRLSVFYEYVDIEISSQNLDSYGSFFQSFFNDLYNEKSSCTYDDNRDHRERNN
jgi:hypothetical protein